MIIDEVKKKYEKESLTKATKTANKTDRAQKKLILKMNTTIKYLM